MTCFVDSDVKKAEQRFIMDRLLPLLATVVSICSDHDRLQSRVTPSGFGLFNRLNVHFIHHISIYFIEVDGSVNDSSPNTMLLV